MRTIVVTGVSRGLGLALVDRFVEAGHRVAGCARGEAAIAELARRHGAPHRFAAIDVGDDEAVARWSADVVDTLGAPELLVNNAALINANNPLWQVPPEEFRRVVDVNITGTYLTIRHFVPAMIAQGRGTIVNISSGWGRGSAPEVGPYCATKWAIEGLTQSLAQELPSGLAAVAVNPGIIHTEMLESCFGSAAAGFADPTAWSAAAAPFLLALSASDNGKALTAPG